MASPKKSQILDLPPPMSLLVTFFIIPPLPHVTMQMVTNSFLDQRHTYLV